MRHCRRFVYALIVWKDGAFYCRSVFNTTTIATWRNRALIYSGPILSENDYILLHVSLKGIFPIRWNFETIGGGLSRSLGAIRLPISFLTNCTDSFEILLNAPAQLYRMGNNNFDDQQRLPGRYCAGRHGSLDSWSHSRIRPATSLLYNSARKAQYRLWTMVSWIWDQWIWRR